MAKNKTSDFEVSHRRARKDIGAAGFQQLQRLRRRLYEPGNSSKRGLSFRYAPSLVARSEAELFGLSMPRFGLRAYLDEAGENFVNARRIGTFCDQSRKWGTRRKGVPGWRANAEVEEAYDPRQPAWSIRKSLCIADSVLSPPQSVLAGFHVIRADLGKVYGEGRKILGTPFVNHISLAGGGLCAQAVCFMATALKHREANGIYGIAEITALAADPELNELTLTGLKHDEIIHYLRGVKLNAWFQKTLVRRTSEKDLTYYRLALRSYVLSDMPVIISVDLGRMRGIAPDGHPLYQPAILGEDDIQRDLATPEEIVPRTHAVLAVGCTDDPAGDRFLVNDPFSVPFLPVTTAQLWECAAYSADEMNGLLEGVFIPVTPGEVRMPLEDFLADPKAGSTSPGLFTIAQMAQQWDGPRPGHTYPRCPSGYLYEPGQFQLVQLRKLVDARIVPEQLRQTLRSWVDCLPAFRERGDHWCWIQFVKSSEWTSDSPDSFWIWDAQKDPPERRAVNASDEFLLCVYERRNGQWRRVFLSDRPVATAAAPEDGSEPCHEIEKRLRDSVLSRERKLQPALITSFSLDGVGVSAETWPAGVAHAELYMLMQPDCEKHLRAGFRRGPWIEQLRKYTLPAKLRNIIRYIPLVRRLQFRRFSVRLRPRQQCPLPLPVVWPVQTAMERMAVLSGDREAALDLAARLSTVLSKAIPVNTPGVIGFATFLPEVTSAGPAAADVGKALAFLIDVAHAFADQGQPISFIEVVGGSLIDGIWRGLRQPSASDVEIQSEFLWRRDIVYVANRLNCDEAIERLCNSLRPAVARELKYRTDHPDRKPVNIALELEPGPLYLLSNWVSLTKLCARLEADPDLSQVVGINLDIGHWRLAGIDYKHVLDNNLVRNRIVHAHVSTQGRGHFADIPLDELEEVPALRAWLDVTDQIGADARDSNLRFSNFASLELEATRYKSLVDRSLETLYSLLR